MRVGLVGCVKEKRYGPAPAGELYISDLFRCRRQVVELTCERWFILSAKHGLVAPETVLERYDVAMSQLGRAQRRVWSSDVLQALHRELGGLDGYVFEIHAGADYIEFGLQTGLEAAGGRVERPLQGIVIGHQLSSYRRWAADAGGAKEAGDRPMSRSPMGKYAPLQVHLGARDDGSLTVRFADIEQILGASLPRSARDHRPWWANSGKTQAQGWLGAGYEVDTVDLRGEWVRFRKVRS